MGTYILISCILTLFWAVTLFDFMNKEDDYFEGKHNKVFWFIIIFFGSFIGASIFTVWYIKKDSVLTQKLDINNSLKNKGIQPSFIAATAESLKNINLNFCYHCGENIEQSDSKCPSCNKTL